MSGWTHYAIPKGLYTEEQIPHTTVKRTLRRGSQGADVAELQAELNARGFDCGAVDGIFGKGTERAVKAFQQDRNLAVDGIVGPSTRAALQFSLL